MPPAIQARSSASGTLLSWKRRVPRAHDRAGSMTSRISSLNDYWRPFLPSAAAAAAALETEEANPGWTTILQEPPAHAVHAVPAHNGIYHQAARCTSCCPASTTSSCPMPTTSALFVATRVARPSGLNQRPLLNRNQLDIAELFPVYDTPRRFSCVVASFL